jgi:hypothetical protein
LPAGSRRPAIGPAEQRDRGNAELEEQAGGANAGSRPSSCVHRAGGRTGKQCGSPQLKRAAVVKSSQAVQASLSLKAIKAKIQGNGSAIGAHVLIARLIPVRILRLPIPRRDSLRNARAASRHFCQLRQRRARHRPLCGVAAPAMRCGCLR